MAKNFIIIYCNNFFGNTVYGASEKSLLLALNLECGADKKEKNLTEIIFLVLRLSTVFMPVGGGTDQGDRLGEIGQTTLNATRTNKSLVINGEGSWIDNKSKKPGNYNLFQKVINQL